MIRNLIGLFVVVVAIILGMGWYHFHSIQSIRTQPLSLFQWADSSGSLPVERVIQTAAFQPATDRRHNFGYTESIHWFRFRLRADAEPRELSLELKNHDLHHVELFVARSDSVTSLGKTGNWQPFEQRPTPTRTFVYPITLDARQTITYYLRLDKRYENLATEILLWQTIDFEDKDQREYFLWGLFAGVVLLVVLINALFWTFTRDTVYLWYGVYVLGLALRQAADTGLGFQFLWPQTAMINHPNALVQSLWLYLPAMLQFQQRFLDLRREARWVYWALQVLKWTFLTAFGTLVIAQFLGIPRWFTGMQLLVTNLHGVLGILVLFTVTGVVWIGLRSDDSLKKLFALQVALQFSGQLFIITQNMMRNRADGVFFVDAYLILSVIFFIDLTGFAYLLAYRYRRSITDNQMLQLNLARTQQETNQKIIAVLESERQQVGDLLLGDVGHRLTETRRILTSTEPSSALTDADRLIGKANDSLTTISRNILPTELAEKGLAQALSDWLRQLDGNHDIRFVFAKTGDAFRLPVGPEVAVYRIAAELINNALKHARATEIRILLDYQPDAVQLIVADNGTGFDPQAARQKDGIGLRNLRTRTAELGGSLTLESGKSGTNARLTVPLEAA